MLPANQDCCPYLYLKRESTFPHIVDIAVRGIREGHTFIWIRPSGHAFVDTFAKTWNTPTGIGPFKSIGLARPTAIYNRLRPLLLRDLQQAGIRKWEQVRRKLCQTFPIANKRGRRLAGRGNFFNRNGNPVLCIERIPVSIQNVFCATRAG
jgi:hypothetical protein